MSDAPVKRRPGRPRKAPEDRRRTPQTSLRIPPDIVARWRDSDPGWQTRMIELLTREAPPL